MAQHMSVSEAILALFRAIGYQLKGAGWLKGGLWFIWLTFTVAFLSATWGSAKEYEPRAAWIYGVIFLVLLVVGLWAFL